ncbi:calmodulin-like protein [Cryptosporidium ubiquitum]|uniref:Calmodulin-like protein n=1 Tax=Cryptosporidium ubiquitum TaxID=857276 RepID=A0A1J4MMW4_9CRYT|nr:calmodulin-like protein [Cryptosporidium ubiquitum]OII75528.1 calmodulin-like protein [Cryptosporidium ubiquitum]
MADLSDIRSGNANTKVSVLFRDEQYCPIVGDTKGRNVETNKRRIPFGMTELTLEHEAALKGLFDTLNTHGDGRIRLNDLIIALRRAFDNGTVTFSRHEASAAEITGEHIDSELEKLKEDFDMNGDGTLNFDEFRRLARMKILRLSRDDEIQLGFRLLDRNNSGYITTLELKQLLTTKGISPLSSEEADELLFIADVNHDGLISYEEIKRYLEYNRKPLLN